MKIYPYTIKRLFYYDFRTPILYISCKHFLILGQNRSIPVACHSFRTEEGSGFTAKHIGGRKLHFSSCAEHKSFL